MWYFIKTGYNVSISTYTAFRAPVGTPLPTFVYVRLHGSKCVDRRRQGDIGTALPMFAYVRLHRRTSCRHTSPKFVHSRRQMLVSPTFELTSMLAFKYQVFALSSPFNTSKPCSTSFTPADQAGRHQGLIFQKSLLISL
jgi:hypothetical protein